MRERDRLSRMPGRSCLFCGSRPVTREHVLPTWVYEALQVYGPITHTHGARPVRITNVFDLVLRAVCATCNNGWLSDLEGRAKDTLTPAITGQPATWDSKQQELAALWAIKTAILLELSARHIRGTGFAPAEHFTHLFTTRTPPPWSMCWTAGVDAKGRDIMWERVTALSLDGTTPQGYFATVAVGYLVLHVFGWVQRAGSAARPMRPVIPPDLRPALAQVWPIVTPTMRWPPTTYFDGHQQLTRLHRSDS